MNSYDKYRFWFEEILGETSLGAKLILVFIIISSLFFLPPLHNFFLSRRGKGYAKGINFGKSYCNI